MGGVADPLCSSLVVELNKFGYDPRHAGAVRLGKMVSVHGLSVLRTFLCNRAHDASTLRGLKRKSVPLELELQVLMSHTVWVLGTKLGSSGKTAGLLNP